ncbi:leucine-rich repeat domain-containing protein [Enterococcus faecium]|uniref:leucine-rich repeat domain-containing protein n=1 Tax=Enterococcus TaxID=1350 RepID=UPI000E6747D8|nr:MULTISPECIES: leucine-rich repeat domain-containing protein [Enterococcus]AYA33477.1 leucine-rich repeat domain-containing protein [Enterococcus faecium]MDT2644887.1 leucine-rich repeat domain-containing protein [Enterococcus dongliensis]
MTNGTSQGLFIVVAIIIFGIFTLTSYVLFKDNLKPTLANIFTNGFNQSTTALNNGIILENNINTDETNSTIYKNQLYVKIRDKNESKNESEVWVLLEELKDATYAIKASGIENTSPIYNIYNPGISGSTSMTGDLILPDTINGKKITLIKEYAFYNSMFNGQLTLPKYLQSIGFKAFYNSNFTGSLTLPDSLQSIEAHAFEYPNFSGELILPDSLQSIGDSAFSGSKFTGSLTLPDSLQSIGANAFGYSNFTGSLTLPDSLQSIGYGAFNYSEFTGELILPNNLSSIGASAFSGSKFTGSLTLPDSLQSIGGSAFSGSKFTGSLTLPDSLQSIGGFAFNSSKFSGTLDISKVTNIGAYAFEKSAISTVKNDSLNNNNKTIDRNAIRMDDGSYYRIN